MTIKIEFWDVKIISHKIIYSKWKNIKTPFTTFDEYILLRYTFKVTSNRKNDYKWNNIIEGVKNGVDKRREKRNMEKSSGARW